MRILGALLGLALLSAVNSAEAQPANGVNCAALSGTPLMCIKNTSPFTIVGVIASPRDGWSPDHWISIPGGPIPPTGTSIVKFDTWSGGCNQIVYVRTSDNRQHGFRSNVCSNTSLVVSGW